jgi:hypothetical protein
MYVVRTGTMIAVAMGTELANEAVGRVIVMGPGVDGVAVGGGVGDGVGAAVGVVIGVGVAVGPVPVIVIRPLGVEAGSCRSRSGSRKIKLSGFGFQTNGLVVPGVLLTLTILRLNNVPDPFSGVKMTEKAVRRAVFIVPGPGRSCRARFQLPAVSPAPWTGGDEKLTTAES